MDSLTWTDKESTYKKIINNEEKFDDSNACYYKKYSTQ